MAIFTTVIFSILKQFCIDNENVKVEIIDTDLKIELKKPDFELDGKFINSLTKYFYVKKIIKKDNVILIKLLYKNGQ